MNQKPKPKKGPKPSGNGQTRPKPRRREPRPKEEPPPPPPTQEATTPAAEPYPRRDGFQLINEDGTYGTGRLASVVRRRPVEWFVPDLIPPGALSFLVGAPESGKSTLGAWLCAQAKRPAILPGSEESVESALVPRLAAAGVALDRCLILDGRLWSMPSDKRTLMTALYNHQADLLWIDPIDTYLGECSENDAQPVRAALETLVWVAQGGPCAVVAARHPGKNPANICPGSRAWRAVPRVILEMARDEGPPVRRWLKPWKWPYEPRMPVRECHIGGEPGEPGRFSLGPVLDRAETEILSIQDRDRRRQIDQAVRLLRALLASGEQESSYLYACAERERIGDSTLRAAGRQIGVLVRRKGSGREHTSHWSLPTPSLCSTDSETPL